MKSFTKFILAAGLLNLLSGVSRAQTPTYTLSPKTLKIMSSVVLTIRSSAYDSCHYTFTHTSLTLSNGSLTASFVPVNDTVCSSVVRPFGPTIGYPSLSGLAAGKYPVYAQLHVACEYSVPACPVAVPIPVFVDTLVVTANVPLFWKQMGIPPAQWMSNDWGLVRGYWLDGRKYTPP